MNADIYMVAYVSGVYMYPASKPYKTKKGVIKAYKKAVEETGSKDLRILKAQWVDADFDEYIQLKNLIESADDSNE